MSFSRAHKLCDLCLRLYFYTYFTLLFRTSSHTQTDLFCSILSVLLCRICDTLTNPDFGPVLSLQDYPKLSQSFYSLLEVLTQDHMNFIASLEPHVIMYILSSISEGLTALGKHSQFTCFLHKESARHSVCITSVCVCWSDTMVCTGCCSSLDHIVTYLFKQLSRSTKKRPTPMATDDRFLHIMQQHPEMIQQVRWSARTFFFWDMVTLCSL